jgi:hypothetical protein
MKPDLVLKCECSQIRREAASSVFSSATTGGKLKNDSECCHSDPERSEAEESLSGNKGLGGFLVVSVI